MPAHYSELNGSVIGFLAFELDNTTKTSNQNGDSCQRQQPTYAVRKICKTSVYFGEIFIES